MTGGQSRLLKVGDRVCWQNDQKDQGTVTEKDWAGVTIKWYIRSVQAILHNDVGQVERCRRRFEQRADAIQLEFKQSICWPAYD